MILLCDDANHNIFKSNSAFPVLSENLGTIQRVFYQNGYDDILQLVHQIRLSMVESVHNLNHPAIIVWQSKWQW